MSQPQGERARSGAPNKFVVQTILKGLSAAAVIIALGLMYAAWNQHTQLVNREAKQGFAGAPPELLVGPFPVK